MSERNKWIAGVGGFVALIVVVFLATNTQVVTGQTIEGPGYKYDIDSGDQATAADIAKLSTKVPVATGLTDTTAVTDGSNVVMAGRLLVPDLPPGGGDDPTVDARLDAYVQQNARQVGYSDAYGPRYRKLGERVALGYEMRATPALPEATVYYLPAGQGQTVYALYCAPTASCTKIAESFELD